MVYYTHPVTLFRQRVSPIYDRLGLPSKSRPPLVIVPPNRPPLKSKVVGILKCATHAQERSDDLYFSAVVFALPHHPHLVQHTRLVLHTRAHILLFLRGYVYRVVKKKKINERFASEIPVRNLLDELRVFSNWNENITTGSLTNNQSEKIKIWLTRSTVMSHLAPAYRFTQSSASGSVVLIIFFFQFFKTHEDVNNQQYGIKWKKKKILNAYT